jgi:hypothetical protein
MLLLIMACQQQQQGVATDYISQEVEHFSLEDVNESSLTFAQTISTSDFPEKVSAWYFGHST